MFPYILCQNCQFPIGQYYKLYKALKNEEVQKYCLATGTKPSNMHVDADMNVRLDGVFKKLKIDSICCRARLLGQTEFREYY